MRAAVLLCLVVACAARTLDEDVAHFADFRSTYGRQYSPSEEARRLTCFRQNMVEIDRLNSLGDHASFGVNHLSDMCAEDFKMYHNLRMELDNRTRNEVAAFSDAEVQAALATGVDWRKKGAVTPVKNQGQCGSCWSFSTTGNMEGQWFLSKGKLVAFSEEELVQCSKNGNQGCNGGLMDTAFEWVVKNGGIDSESDYAYTSGGGTTGKCKTSKEKVDVAKFSGHVDLKHDEKQMATWLAKKGPVAIAVDAAAGWQSYNGGIMTTCKGKQLDHGVLLVGYGTENGQDFWVIKNSWGPSWGENGYIRVGRGTNQCGLTQLPASIQV